MAILISTKVKGQTTEGYNSVLAAVKESVMNADGFIMHCAHPDDGEWKVYELWQSKEQADRWFAATVVPNLPPGIHPKRSYTDLHSLLTPSDSFVVQ
jgi:quinol monooxygenase YgiN